MWKAVSLALAVTLLIVAAAQAQRRHPSLVTEDAYREALADLADGSLGQAVGRVLGLEEQTSARCVQAIELHTAQRLARLEPESLVAQAILRLAVQRVRNQNSRPSIRLFGFERVSITSLRQLGDSYVATSQRQDAPSVVAGLLTYMAHEVAAARSAERLDVARDLLEAALELDGEHLAALHSLAVALELRGHPEQALKHLDRLLEIEPEDPRLRLRRAIATVKSDRLERGRRLLEELTTDGPVWVRDLATQELARLLLAGGRKDEAEVLLRDGLLELPREKLSLQLAALLDPQWTDSEEVLDAWLSEPGEPAELPETGRRAGATARWIYEDGAKDEIDALRLEISSNLTERSAALGSALGRLHDLSDYDRKTFPVCL